jgi:hypothetical protein
MTTSMRITGNIGNIGGNVMLGIVIYDIKLSYINKRMSLPLSLPLSDALLLSDLHIQKFDIDTDETIRQRIAAKLKTIPKWIWISDDKRFYALRNQVISSTNSSINKSFDAFVEQHFNGDLSTNPYNATPTEIAKYWLSEQSPERISQDHVIDTIILDFKKHKIDMVMVEETVIVDDKPIVVKKIIDDNQKVYDIIVTQFYNKDRKTFQKDLADLVSTNIDVSSSLEKYQTMMADLVPQPHFEFQEIKVNMMIKTNLKEKDMSLSSIFANIVCDKNVPLFSYQELYKVVDDLPFLLSLLHSKNNADWTLKGYDAIRGHVSHIVEKEEDKSNYSNCYFFFEKDKDGDDKTLMIMIVLTYKANENKKIKKRMVVERLQNAMSHIFSESDFDQFDQFEEDIVGIAIFPNLSFDTIILSDMIMNDRLFSTVMSVDESEQASKIKEGLYTHFFIDKFDGTCSITSKIADDKNQELKFIKFSDLPPGTPFVRARISFEKNMDVINKFLTILSKLLTYYTKNAASIRRIYNAYGIDTSDKIDVKEDEEDDMKDDGQTDEEGVLSQRFPEIFVAGYPSICGHVIKEIHKDDVEGDEYKTWMRFPRDSEAYFSCSHRKNYPFIGVIKNTLSNKDTFPYLPCCFKINQLDKEKSKLKNYLQGILPQKTTYQQNVIITSKFALNDNFGELPQSISFLFQTIRKVDDGCKFERKGVLDTPFSFLNCVLKGTRNILPFDDEKDGKDGKKDVSKKDKNEEKKLMEEYEKLIDYPNICVASQENPGDTVNDMRRTLRANDYMDPRRWIRLLEVVYSVKIIVFSKDKKTGHVSIQLPHAHQMHLRWNDPAKSIICIYEHYGSDSDTPRCELIIEKEEKLMMGKKEEIIHNSFIRARLNIDTFYDNMLYQWSYNHENHENTISTIKSFDTLPFLTKKDRQAVDPYGKTRALLINSHFVILTSPLPPLDLRAMSDDNDYDLYQSYDVNDRYIQAFLSEYEPSAITVNSNDDITEIHFSITDITLTIKTNPFRFDNDNGLTRLTQPLYPSSDQNLITKHIEKTRLASILIEYFLYYFSWYCRESGITAEQVEADKKGELRKFKERVIVDERVLYTVPKTSNVSIRSMKANHFISNTSNNHFVCDSKESRKRLLYTLYTHLLNQFDSVMSYAHQSEIRHFYSSASDYATQTKDTLIVNKLDILQVVNGDVHDTLQLESDIFFMKNELISPTPVEVKKGYTLFKDVNPQTQKVIKVIKKPSLTEAIKKGMRKECEDVDNEDECPVRYVLYQSRNEVDIHGREDETNADVLVYKMDGKLHYNGLLIL